jgi:hypothetical protein
VFGRAAGPTTAVVEVVTLPVADEVRLRARMLARLLAPAARLTYAEAKRSKLISLVISMN